MALNQPINTETSGYCRHYRRKVAQGGGVTDTVVFTYTGASSTFTVPAGVSQLRVKLWGGGGSGFVGSMSDAGNVAGNYQTPGADTDVDRSGAGAGGALVTAGGNGRIVIAY